MKKMLLALMIMLSLSAHATDYTWIGAVSGDMDDTNNWDLLAFPTANDDVYDHSGDYYDNSMSSGSLSCSNLYVGAYSRNGIMGGDFTGVRYLHLNNYVYGGYFPATLTYIGGYSANIRGGTWDCAITNGAINLTYGTLAGAGSVSTNVGVNWTSLESGACINGLTWNLPITIPNAKSLIISNGTFNGSVMLGNYVGVDSGTFNNTVTNKGWVNDAEFYAPVVNYGTLYSGYYYARVTNAIGGMIEYASCNFYGGVADYNPRVWNGSVDGDMDNSANWTPNIIPETYNTAIIPLVAGASVSAGICYAASVSQSGGIYGGVWLGVVTNESADILGGVYSNKVITINASICDGYFSSSCTIDNSNGGVVKGGTFDCDITNGTVDIADTYLYGTGTVYPDVTLANSGGTLDGMTYLGVVSLNISDTAIESGIFKNIVTNAGSIYNGIFECPVVLIDWGGIDDGTFSNTVTVGSTAWIYGGIYRGLVDNYGMLDSGIAGEYYGNIINEEGAFITSGIFSNAPVANYGDISGGDFYAVVTNKLGGTISGGNFYGGLVDENPLVWIGIINGDMDNVGNWSITPVAYKTAIIDGTEANFISTGMMLSTNVINSSTIKGGTFPAYCKIDNSLGTINNGTYDCDITNGTILLDIESAFYGTGTVHSAVTITEGSPAAYIYGMTWNCALTPTTAGIGIYGGTFNGGITSSDAAFGIAGGTFTTNCPVSGTLAIYGGEFYGQVSADSISAINSGNYYELFDCYTSFTGGTCYSNLVIESGGSFLSGITYGLVTVLSGGYNQGTLGNNVTFNGGENDSTVGNYASFINGGWNTGSGTVGNYAMFNDDGYNDGIVGDYATFNDYNYISGSGTVGNYATFNDYSYNYGIVGDYATFNDSNYSSGTVGDHATFNDSSYNDTGAVGDHATFNDYVNNNGTVLDYATFNDNSYSLNGSLGDHATFNDSSYNYNGMVGDYATFNGESYNYNGFVGNYFIINSANCYNNAGYWGMTAPLPTPSEVKEKVSFGQAQTGTLKSGGGINGSSILGLP